MAQTPATAQHFVTTSDRPWQRAASVPVSTVAVGVAGADVRVKVEEPQQAIEGFGACFNELGWTSLALLEPSDRDGVMRELFAPGVGAGLNLCRMPIGANDFSRDWYSYDETAGDLALRDFSIENDSATLVPFIRAAMAHQPELRVWASPWSPPTWMKRNGHYAGAVQLPTAEDPGNGLRSDQVGAEGTDMFRTDDVHLSAYAAYFGRFIDAYRALGIRVGMVMPQNEFNSAQPFPSCTWTAGGLTSFLRHLGPEMRARDVEIFLGTLERADDRLATRVLEDPEAAQYVSGLGVQWEGKKAVMALHRRHSDLRIYQTEQECGDGRNDWRYARYAWRLMRRFFESGANAYMYWNVSLIEGGRSRWGWTQNSLVTIDPDSRTHRFTFDYHLLKHVSAYTQPGARFIDTWSIAGFDNQLVFANPDGSVVLIVHNDSNEVLQTSFQVGDRIIVPTLAADSLNTIVIPATRTANP